MFLPIKKRTVDYPAIGCSLLYTVNLTCTSTVLIKNDNFRLPVETGWSRPTSGNNIGDLKTGQSKSGNI